MYGEATPGTFVLDWLPPFQGACPAVAQQSGSVFRPQARCAGRRPSPRQAASRPSRRAAHMLAPHRGVQRAILAAVAAQKDISLVELADLLRDRAWRFVRGQHRLALPRPPRHDLQKNCARGRAGAARRRGPAPGPGTQSAGPGRPSCGRDFAISGLGSTVAVETSSSGSTICPGSAPAPNGVRRSVSNIARNLPFSSRSSTIISITVSGSRAADERRRTPCQSVPNHTDVSLEFVAGAGASIRPGPGAVPRRAQSMPPNNRRSCMVFSVTAPSRTGGQMNAPFSSHLVNKQSLEPSQANI